MHWKKTRTRTKIGATAVAAVVTGALTFTALTQVPATAVQPVTDTLRIDHFLEAKLDFADMVPGDPYAGFESALTNPNTTVQWGWLDPAVPPKLIMNSGETVAVETMMHSHNLIQPGTSMNDIVALRLANPNAGPHTLTGPIYVNDAQPGDIMEIRIKKIVTKGFGANFNLPGSQFPNIGALNDKAFAAPGFVKYFFFEPDKRKAEFKPGINVDLKPFPGTLAVGIDPRDPSRRRGPAPGVTLDPVANPMAPVSTLRPYKNGSNMDLNELGAGSTVYIPIFLEGGLVWTGDSHCRQGNGEVNLTALECSYDHIVFQLVVRKDLNWQTEPWREWPMAETKTHWILMGFADGSETHIPGNGPLDKAFRLAIDNTVEFLAATQGVTRLEAYSLASMLADCRVTQVVDVRKGVHCMVPKANFTNRRSGQAS